MVKVCYIEKGIVFQENGDKTSSSEYSELNIVVFFYFSFPLHIVSSLTLFLSIQNRNQYFIY